jgi:hypothetical protein
MHTLGLRDLPFLARGTTAGGSGGGGGSGGSGGGGSGGGGSGGSQSPLTLSDFDAYWRMDGNHLPGVDYYYEDDATGNGHWLHHNFDWENNGPGVVIPPGGPGEGIPGGGGATPGAYRVLGLDGNNRHDGGYESLNIYLGTGTPPAGAYPLLGATASYTFVFWFRWLPGQSGGLAAYNAAGQGIWALNLPPLTYADGAWHLVVFGRDYAGGVLFTSIDGATLQTSPDDGHNFGYFAFLPTADFPGTPGDDGEYADHEVLNAHIDATGLMPRAITQAEINWLWNGGTGREL